MFKFFAATLALVASTLLPTVSAHGWISAVAVDGTIYSGNRPGTSNPVKSPIRIITDAGPVKGTSNPDLSCGFGAHTPAPMVVPAQPGSRVTFQWDSGSGHWVHNTGPMMTYMAECTGTTCDKFDSSKAQWFKIDQAGRKSGQMTWFQQDVQSGDSMTVTLPSNLKKAQYLIRHEIIALHLATSEGGVEFYPGCMQIDLAGPSSAAKAPATTVSFPGAYAAADPGIFTPDVFNPGNKYVFPGPQLDPQAAKKSAITVPIKAAGSSSNQKRSIGSGLFSRIVRPIFGDLAAHNDA